MPVGGSRVPTGRKRTQIPDFGATTHGPRHFQKLAELIEREFGGFVPPKMFDD
jgi:hypothetical protein